MSCVWLDRYVNVGLKIDFEILVNLTPEPDNQIDSGLLLRWAMIDSQDSSLPSIEEARFAKQVFGLFPCQRKVEIVDINRFHVRIGRDGGDVMNT